MLNYLEELQSVCTEEGNQTAQECDIITAQECDIIVKAQRNDWIRKLEHKISDPMTLIRTKLKQGTHSLRELTDMLHVLESQAELYMEEGNQTNDKCDVIAKAEREDLMRMLEAQIVSQQGKASKKTDL